MSGFEVPTPIQNTPYEEPKRYWYIREGESPELREGRRPSVIYAPSDTPVPWDVSGGLLKPSKEFAPGYEMALVNLIRERLRLWRKEGYHDISRVTRELLEWWRRDGRKTPLFFAQLEAAETVIFLREARQDYLQGIDVPLDQPNESQKGQGINAFLRYALKMATGSGKTTVMGMLAAWSILNKVANRADARFSDVVVIICPNITIRNRLQELNPEQGDASLYRTRDLVPGNEHVMSQLRQGKVLVTNWHVFQLQEVGDAKVKKVGVPQSKLETIYIGKKTTTAHGHRYLSLQDYEMQVGTGMLTVRKEHTDKDGSLEKVEVESLRYVESDAHWDRRVLGMEIGGKQNILVMNDEAHHAYRIRRPDTEETEDDTFGEEEEAEEFFVEATVWVDGLDRIHKMRGLNFCVDLSATPYFLGRVGQDTNKPFPWVVADFGLTDSIEAGLVKIPQLALRDPTGAARPAYFNLWQWILDKLTARERGGKKASPKPEAILKHAHHPIALLGGQWEEKRKDWQANEDDDRPPVFIIVCKTTKIADVVYEWLANGNAPAEIPPANVEGLRNRDGRINTIRIDSKVVHETDTEYAKSDEMKWLRLTLDTVGKRDWPRDQQGRPIYPEGFEDLAKKMTRPLHPPGRDIRCIVSVGMLTEGWDCNTVTHIVGLRPFMSQLLCEQVVGRGLRRTDYEVAEDGKLSEEVAQILGVPFEVIPYKAAPEPGERQVRERKHVHAIPEKEHYRIESPRVEGYTQPIRNRITVDWDALPSLTLDPTKIPPEVEMKANIPNNQGRPSLFGPGRIERIDLSPYRKGRRFQELTFELARDLTRDLRSRPECDLPAHVLFPQALQAAEKYLRERVRPVAPAELIDAFLSPYYGWVIEQLREGIRGDTDRGEVPEVPRYEQRRGPGSTDDVDFWTTKDVWATENSHVNYVVADTRRWEQSSSYFIDGHAATDAFVKNAGLGFAIPYLHNGEPHDYIPDFIVRLKARPEAPQQRHLILETKGFDELEEVKTAAAMRWVKAVNADGRHGEWHYKVARSPADVTHILDALLPS